MNICYLCQASDSSLSKELHGYRIAKKFLSALDVSGYRHLTIEKSVENVKFLPELPFSINI